MMLAVLFGWWLALVVWASFVWVARVVWRAGDRDRSLSSKQ